jgi:hypothetical protein
MTHTFNSADIRNIEKTRELELKPQKVEQKKPPPFIAPHRPRGGYRYPQPSLKEQLAQQEEPEKYTEYKNIFHKAVFQGSTRFIKDTNFRNELLRRWTTSSDLQKLAMEDITPRITNRYLLYILTMGSHYLKLLQEQI